MIRRLAGAAAMAIGLFALTGTSMAEAPAGPRLAVVEWKVTKPMHVRVVDFDADGGDRRNIGLGAVEPTIFAGVSWAPDGSSLLFAGFPAGRSEKDRSRIYLVPAGGGVAQPISGTGGATDPVLSPDGTTLAFARTRLRLHLNPKHPLNYHFYSSTTTWVVSLASGRTRRLTPWRNGLSVAPSSFSPDGRTLLLDRGRNPDGGPEVVALDLADGRMAVLARAAISPAYSSDGTRIALVSYRDRLTVEGADGPVSVGELYVMHADGSHLRRLTKTPEQQEADPSWDPSGRRLAYIRSSTSEELGLGLTNVVMEVNADGTCPTRVFGKPHRNWRSGPGIYAPSWQPGPGRGAGPISC